MHGIRRQCTTHRNYVPCFSCRPVQIVTADVGSMAVVSKSMCLITPSLPITNVVRRANSTLSFPIGNG